jgi:RNA polymerase sigma-70 factor (ECF subfamily)
MTLDDAAVERIVGEAQSGDSWAFGLLFDHFHEPIYRYIASRVHRPTDAEDLTQLVFVKALEALPRYEARGVPFGGWLFRLARNAVIDFVRTRHDHGGLDSVLERPGHEAGPEAIAQVREDLNAVAAALESLTDEQREAIALRFFAGLSAREAAEAMGKQEGTVRGLQFRAIAALRRELGVDLTDQLDRPVRRPPAAARLGAEHHSS